jgi:membrane-associated PAP2 superfamily phosphatase
MISPMLRQLSSISSEQRPCIWRPYALVSLILLIAFLAWDSTTWDMQLATIWGEHSGFALRDNWWMAQIMHAGARNSGWIFFLAVLLSIWRPWGPLRALPTADRVSLFLSVLSALLAVTLIKGISQTSCPWDLQAFGGVAPYVSHWNLWVRDGGGGHCFPAGHASTGFAFMAAYFGLRQNNAPGAIKWLILASSVGFILGFSQQMRGAHFMSHTLWTAWLCWTVGWVSHCIFFLVVRKKKS